MANKCEDCKYFYPLDSIQIDPPPAPPLDIGGCTFNPPLSILLSRDKKQRYPLMENNDRCGQFETAL